MKKGKGNRKGKGKKERKRQEKWGKGKNKKGKRRRERGKQCEQDAKITKNTLAAIRKSKPITVNKRKQSSCRQALPAEGCEGQDPTKHRWKKGMRQDLLKVMKDEHKLRICKYEWSRKCLLRPLGRPQKPAQLAGTSTGPGGSSTPKNLQDPDTLT